MTGELVSQRAQSWPRPAALMPTGTARAAFQRAAGVRGDDDPALPAELRAALSAHDVGEETLWAAWEVAQWATAAPDDQRRALTCLVIALLTTIEGGGTCLTLDAGEDSPERGPTADRPPRRQGLVGTLTRLGVGETDTKAACALAARLRGALATSAGKGKTSSRTPADPAPSISALFDVEDSAEAPKRTGARRPFLVRDGDLYPERLWWLEERLVTLITPRLTGATEPLATAAATEAALGAVRDGEGAPPLTDEQQSAVRTALVNRLTLVAGGPGAGKTSTVVALLRTLVRLGVMPEEIALAAPTGRAAQRMKESVEGALARLQSPAPEDLLLGSRFTGATTLHGLLGIRPGGRRPLAPALPEFYEDWPLPQRVVIVDEASMIDMMLMEQLCAAAAPRAHLILIGDVDQLPSVDVGAVFRDLVLGAPAATCHLTRSHRMDPLDPAGADILRLAAGVNAGTVDAQALRHRSHAAALAFAGAEGLGGDALDGLLDRWHGEVLSADKNAELALDHRYGVDQTNTIANDPPNDAGRAVKALVDTVLSARILCLTRTAGRGTSAAAINRLMHARVQAAALARGVDEAMAVAPFVPGEPVIVMRNDRTLGLANGDLGVVLRVHGAHHDRLGVAFPRGNGFVVHPLDAISADLGLAFALTVHKAQGSEYQQVALVLPEVDVPLLTREVLYTALTRARHGVVVLGEPALLALGAGRTLARSSGIVKRMAVATGPAAGGEGKRAGH